MKKLAFLLAATASISFTYAQKVSEKEVPAVVKSALQKEFPTIKTIRWEKEKDNFEAGFIQDHKDYSVLINPSGNILETEMAIPVNMLPEKARAYIHQNYPSKKIAESAKITDAKGNLTYEAEVGKKDLIFDSKGHFIKVAQ